MASRQAAAAIVFLGLADLAAGCHRGHVANAPSQTAAAGTPPTEARTPFTPESIGRPLSGSTVALARVAGKRIAYVADGDASLVRRVDLDAKAELEPIAVGAEPASLMILDNGRIAVVTRDGMLSTVGDFDAVDDQGTNRAWIHVAPEPRALALSPDGSMLYVASGWGHALAAYRTKDFERTFELDLAREPRSLAVSDDGKQVFVTHAVGSHVSIVDVGDRVAVRLVGMQGKDDRPSANDPELVRALNAKQRAARDRRLRDGLPTCQSFGLAKSAALPGRIFVPEVMVDPGEAEVKSPGYGSSDGEAAETPTVAVLETSSGQPIASSLRREARNADGRKADDHPCLLPRAAAIDDASRTLLVACQGIDALVAYDAMSPTPAHAELRRWNVGSGPNGIAVDGASREAVVWSQFDRTLSIVALDAPAPAPSAPPASGTKPATHAEKDDLGEKDHAKARLGFTQASPNLVGPSIRIALGRSVEPTADALGRMLFHRTGDSRISSDGRACASCHPDGRDDGLVWSTPEGPRRSIMLAGRLSDTAPFSWQGNSSTVQKHLHGTFERLGGSGLTGAELDALVGYVKTISGRRYQERAELADESAAVGLGAKIFASKKAGCSGCHSGPTLTDGSMHNVGSGRAFNTPSLLNVGSGGPWFHDGRYATLQELLQKSDGKMGHTKHLSAVELSYLESFLRAQ